MSRLAPLELQLLIPDGPEDEWEVLAAQIDEALDATYEARLDLAVERLDLSADELLGLSCELSMQRADAPPRLVYGVIAHVELLGVDAHRLRVSLTLVPAFALARQRRGSRIWQDSSVQRIVSQVLRESLEPYARCVDFGQLRRGEAPRDYCVQYRESDFDFVCRLLEEEGVCWHFVHDAQRGHEVLTLRDHNEDYPRFCNLDGAAALPMIANNPDEAELESLQRFAWARALRPTSASLSEYDPKHPGSVGGAAVEGVDVRGHARRVYDHGQRRVYDHAPHGLASHGLDTRAADLVTALRAKGSLATAGGNASLVSVGQRCVIEGLSHEGAPGEWIVLSARHRFSAQPTTQRYGVEFELAPAELELRPLERTDKPMIYGPQTATVVGEGEIDVDSQGRIQVQFHWQEQASFAAGASCRLRCAQSWAGAGWGAQFIPRVGMEVVVEFLEGNPDRPLVTGCVYNGVSEPPFGQLDGATQSGWRTSSSPGGGGHNELRFEDAAGAEEIYVHAQRDANTQIKHDRHVHVGHDATTTVGNKRSEAIGADEVRTIGANHSLSVGGEQRVQVGAEQTLLVGAGQTIRVGASRSLSVGASCDETIAAHAAQSVGVSKTVAVGGMLATIVGGVMNTSVGAASLEEVAGVKTVTVGAGSSESVGGAKSVGAAQISLSASAGISASAGGGVSVRAGEGLELSAGAELVVTGKKKGLLEFADELTIKVGKASVTLKRSGEILLSGTSIDVEGKKSITLDAKVVNQN